MVDKIARLLWRWLIWLGIWSIMETLDILPVWPLIILGIVGICLAIYSEK